jgi:prevent-host-death family protein
MQRRIAASEFKAQCLHLLDEVRQSREEIVIANRGRAVARLLPADEELPTILGRMRGSAEICGDIVAPVGEKWSVDE